MSLSINEKLLRCGILDKLKLNSEKYVSVKDSKNLLATHGRYIFVWHDAGTCILAAEINSDKIVEKFIKLNHVTIESYKTLTLTNPPVFEVDSLLFNQTGNLLALSGKNGVTIYEVPWRYGKFGTEGVNGEIVIGQSWHIAECFFICTNRVQVVQIAWHPGSTSKTHITVLSTDSYIRIYDVSDSQVPQQAISLGANCHNSYLSSDAKITFSSCYGENAVGFDFGSPEAMHVPHLAVTRGKKEYELKTVWPIFLLHGNGDVFILKVPLKKEKSQPYYKLVGPLDMYPPAEDNYGYDACAILCLPSTPTALVIATAAGVLYHCLVLDNISGDAPNAEKLFSPLDTNASETCEALYVFESVELPLTLTEDQDDVYTNPVRLYKDMISHSKYHCTHVSGLHSVAMPFLQALGRNSGADELKQVLDQQKQPCIVEHILCTKPFSEMKAVPVIGLDSTVISGGIVLICLLATWEFVSFPIVSSFLPPALCLLHNLDSTKEQEEEHFSSTFEQSLEKNIQRSVCSPFVKSFPSSESITSPQQWLDLLCNVTQRFREDYIQRLTTSYALLRSKIKVLAQQKEYQLADLKRCEQERENLKAGAERLAEKYEDANASQQILQKRIENVLKNLQLHSPYLSKAEVEMKQTLLNYEEKIKGFEVCLDQIKKKMKYQEEKKKEMGDTSRRIVSLREDMKYVSFNETQIKHVKELLAQEGNSISELTKSTCILRKQLGLY